MSFHRQRIAETNGDRIIEMADGKINQCSEITASAEEKNKVQHSDDKTFNQKGYQLTEADFA